MFWVTYISHSIPFFHSFLPIIVLPHYVSSLSASFCLSTGSSLEQKPQGGSGYVSSWKPQVTPASETASPSPLNPASALLLCGPPPPPLPPQPYISQTALVFPTDQDAGTEAKRNTDVVPVWLELISNRVTYPCQYTSMCLPCWLLGLDFKCLISSMYFSHFRI